MNLETETVLDRRRLRRLLSFWRVLALGAIVAAVGLFIAANEQGWSLTDRAQIARVNIQGMITDDRDMDKLLEQIAKAKHVKGVVLAINSPGGTTTGGESLFEGLRRLAEKKPVVAQFGTVAASAAYIAGLGSDHIVSRGNTITGSVGVIVQWPEVSQLLEKIGVKINEIKSGPLKATPSPFQVTDEAGRRLTQDMVAESQRWFVDLVKVRRGIDPSQVPGLLDGRIFSGREAQRLNLVDEIGGEREAVRWLKEKRGVAEGAVVVDWKPRSDGWSFGSSATGMIRSLITSFTTDFAQVLRPQFGALGLDGMLSVWHPAEN